MQFTELGRENRIVDAWQKIAEFGEAQRAKREAPDRLDFPFAAQNVDGRLKRTTVVNFHGAPGFTELFVLPPGKVPL